MKIPWLFLVTSLVFVSLNTAWADKPAPTWNGKPADKMTAQEMRDANKALDQQIKKGDSSAVQKKTDLNKAFDKTPEGQKMKKEDRLAAAKDELAIADKQWDANAEWEIDYRNMEDILKERGDYWKEPKKWPAPPDGNIGPGGDRDRMARKLKEREEKAKKAKEEAKRKAEALRKEIEKLQDELYAKSGDTKKMPAPGEEVEGPVKGSGTGMIDSGGRGLNPFDTFQMPTVVTSTQGSSGSNQSTQGQTQPAQQNCPQPSK